MRRLTATFTVLLQGCSFAFVSGPPANHAQLPAVDCTTSNLVPVLDTVFAVLEVLNLSLAAKDSNDEWRNLFCNNSTDPSCNAPLSRGAAIPLYLALGAVGAASAYYGYSRVGQCKDAKAQLMQRQVTQPPTQGTWPPPGLPPQSPPAGPPPTQGTWPPPAAPSGPPPPEPPPPPAQP